MRNTHTSIIKYHTLSTLSIPHSIRGGFAQFGEVYSPLCGGIGLLPQSFSGLGHFITTIPRSFIVMSNISGTTRSWSYIVLIVSLWCPLYYMSLYTLKVVFLSHIVLLGHV